MSNPWFRLYAEFATDPKIQMMSEVYQRRYIMLLCLRCSNGDVTLQDDETAFQLRIGNEEWLETKRVFIEKNLVTADGKIPAWDRRQYISDSSAERVARHREKKKLQCNVTVTTPEADTDTEADISTPSGVDSRKRGTRLSADAAFPDEWVEFCKTERPDLNPEDVFAKFRDYWASKPGKAGTKLDWMATWRNWVREERQPRSKANANTNVNRNGAAMASYGTIFTPTPEEQGNGRTIDATPRLG